MRVNRQGGEHEDTPLMCHMPALHLFGRNAGVAEALRSKRSQIAAAMLEHAVRRFELTVGAEILALSFVDRFIDAVIDDDWARFYVWIDRMCERYAEMPSNARMLVQGSSVIVSQVRATVPEIPAIGAEFEAVGEHVARIAEGSRARSLAVSRTLDEVDASLNRLMSQLTKFDAATAEHSRAVSMWCARIGRKMGLSSGETILLMRAGLIHDIGKVTTPLPILNAPHRLSDPDMVIMRRHAEAGAAMVGDIPRLAHLTPTVRGHHERIDGRGYPDGRVGSEIPLTVRIVSVADCFNAMIGNRPYRLPMAPTAALEQLKIHSGTQFDHNVVSAMIEVVGRQR